MAGRPPSEKTFSNMLRIAIKDAHESGGDKLRMVAEALVNKAISGDVPAIKEFADRLEGKIPQAIEADHQHEAGDTLTAFMRQMWKSGEGSIMPLSDDSNDTE